ncbi:hypothetical protein ASE21_11850 [Flavobacterium sp. Root901]|uniref:contractile injection system tape measure protein n=1 Tax=Flavobacterium sp. Root901 TaxID=1736605 RepID=UPI00070CC6FF|nr:contractile injection system tape measure protein [Flavobacterium sp. Root901]KRD10392.1 hypothetical protein ASE21_11850 [Flavobacterium sp. Root901]
MEEINRHIISSLKWDTTFDQKEEGYKLQERLSSWSKISLPREVAAVFNELCPPEQSWRIQSLELDLGACDYHDLEFDLSNKIRTLLRDKIAELIIYQNSQKQNLISVYNKEKSILENLTVFLIEGYLPWSYQSKEGSVNHIMAEVLQNSLSEIIAIIKQEGIKQEQVRKRIAWQFDERNTNKIIAALEPNNSGTILEFSSIITSLQVKETIVQTSAASFKKNLYFFILNFLLLERGTLFNKVAFMKSSILQMANHYNIAYSELIVLIENTVIKISDNTTRNNDFIYSLRTLTQEFEGERKEHFTIEKNTDYWQLLEKLFENKSERKTKAQRDILNELIAALYTENSGKFKAVISRMIKNGNEFVNVIQDLDDAAVQVVFAAVNIDSSALHSHTISYITKLIAILKLKVNPKFLWQTAIAYAVKNKNGSHGALLLHCITELSQKSNIKTEKLLGMLTTAQIPTAIKNNHSVIIYERLNTLYCQQIDKNQTDYPAVHFTNLIVRLENELQKNAAKNTVFKELQRSLIKNIHLHPKTAFEVMLSYQNKEFIRTLLPLILNRELLQLIIKTANYKKTKLVQTVQIVYEILNAREKYNLHEELLTDDLLWLSIQEILLHPEQTSSLFMETVLIQLSRKTANGKRHDFYRFITKLLQSKRIKSFGITIKKNFLIQLKNNNSIDIIELALLMQNTSKQAQSSLSSVLRSHFDDPIFKALRKEAKKESDVILEYLLKNSKTLKNKWIKDQTDYIIQLSKSVSVVKIRSDLSEIFWKTILNYPAYKGSAVEFQKLLDKALFFYLKNQVPAVYQIINEAKATQGIEYKYEPNFKIQKEIQTELYKTENTDEPDEIEEPISEETEYGTSFKTEKKHILFSGIKLSPKEKYKWFVMIICEKQIPQELLLLGEFKAADLLDEIIAADSKLFFQILKKEFISEAQTDWLSRNIVFNTLCAAVNRQDQSRESYLKILEKFHHTLGRISINGISSKEIQALLLRKVLKAAANDNWRLITISTIWNELIWDIVTRKGISKKSFLIDIEKHIYQFPPSLQLSFREIVKNEKRKMQTSKIMENPAKNGATKDTKPTKTHLKEGLPVRNAGMVLLNNYYQMLLERLNLVENGKFTSSENQIKAVQYLQYVVTGITTTEETYLTLNKVLCGLPLSNPVPDEIEIGDDQENLINGMMQAAISYWDVIGETSVDGFRGNWLVRDGILVEQEERWELTVDKRAYDILINKSPFAFSIIKYPWMPKPLHVNWPY